MSIDIYEQIFNIEIGDVGYSNKLSNHAILKFMQEISAMHSEVVGFGLNSKDVTHVAWVLLNWKLQVFKRPRWNSQIRVRTWVNTFDRVHSLRDFEIFDEHNNIVAIGSSKWVIINSETNILQKITPELASAYVALNKSVFDTKINYKLVEPTSYNYSKLYTIQRRDIDTNNHLNNLCYLDYAIETLPEDIYLNDEFNNVEIMYKKETKLGENISCLYSEVDNEKIITIKSENNKDLHSIVKLY